ncbi:hypothetical protein QEN19_003937 [Hanseniaspora menglaensis]
MSPQFGHAFKDKYFQYLDPTANVVNHGSYGTTPSMVIDTQIASVKEHELYPDRFEYIDGPIEYKKHAKITAEYFGLNWKNLALVQNATTGINVFLRSIPFDWENDLVILPNTTYGACSNTVKFLHNNFGLKYKFVDLVFPLETKEILNKFEQVFKKEVSNHSGEIFCLFDCISSMPGVTMPYEELILLCKKYGIKQVIDGAHAPGQIDLKFLDILKPDFFTGNLHKWVSVPKSCAIIYAQEEWHTVLQSQPISWTYNLTKDSIASDESLLVERFSKVGTINYSVYCSIKSALKFRSEICGGEDNIRNYQKQLSSKASAAIKEIFNVSSNDKYDHYESKLLENNAGTLTPVGMFCISYPINLSKYSRVYNKLIGSPLEYLAVIRSLLEKSTIAKYKNYSPLVFHGNILYFRFSVQIFNELSDFTTAAKINKILLEDVFATEEDRLSNSCKPSKL